jgi:type II secretory pathway pseudopilin PulG
MRRAPFTFIEVLTAVVVVALIVPVAVQGINFARRLSGDDERLELAARLADEKLSELVVTGDWQDGEEEGTFEDEPDYQWSVTTDDFSSEEIVSLTVVRVTVSFTDAVRPTSASLSTLVSSETVEE